MLPLHLSVAVSSTIYQFFHSIILAFNIYIQSYPDLLVPEQYIYDLSLLESSGNNLLWTHKLLLCFLILVMILWYFLKRIDLFLSKKKELNCMGIKLKSSTLVQIIPSCVVYLPGYTERYCMYLWFLIMDHNCYLCGWFDLSCTQSKPVVFFKPM